MAVAWTIWPLGRIHNVGNLNPIIILLVTNEYSTIWFLPFNIHVLLMSPTAASSTGFQLILDAAFDSYANQTGIDLSKHPSANKLQHCHSVEDLLQLLLEREAAFIGYQDKHRKLIDSLRPVVKIVHGFSTFLGEVAGLVSFGQPIQLLWLNPHCSQ